MSKDLKSALRAGLVVTMVFAAGACVSTSPTKYKFSPPTSGRAAHARLAAINKVTKDCVGCKKCSEACAMYEMEAGLIYQKVLQMDLDAISHYRRAIRFNDESCDARLLLASALGRQIRNDAAVFEASQLMASRLDGCGGGTVATFHRAKMNVFSGDGERVQRGREELEAMSTVRVGESGITQEDIHNVLLYSFLADARFDAAARRMAESPEVSLSPKLLALMYIGQGRAGELAEIELEGRAEVRVFLLDALADYRPQPALEQLVSETSNRLGAVEAIPWDRLNEQWAAADETPWQEEIQKVIVEDEYQRLTAALNDRKEALAGIEHNLARLQQAELDLLTQVINSGLGGGPSNTEDAFMSYVRAHQKLGKGMEGLTIALKDITDLNYIEHFLADLGDLHTEAQVVNEFERRRQEITEEDVVVEVLQGFAIAKSRALRPVDFFRPFTIELDQLSPEAEPVKRSVRAVAKLEGREL